MWKRGKHSPCTELLREVIRYVGRALSAVGAVGGAERDPWVEGCERRAACAMGLRNLRRVPRT